MKIPPPPPKEAVEFCDFVTASPTPFHAVQNLSKRLLSSGFTQISERTPTSELSLKSGSSYFYTRNQSSIVAFTLPETSSNETTIDFAVGHLDSCCLKIRPISKRVKENYLQVGVELYGGGIWATWFDRDLSIAGRVIVAVPNAGSGEPSYVSKLVKIDRPLLRIPNLAIHLDRTINEAFKFNKETQFRPILGLVADQLNDSKGGRSTPMPFSGRTSPVSGEKEKEVKEDKDAAKMEDKHHPLMLAVLADELGCSIGDIQDFELSLFDTQPSCVGGLSNEFIFSPRIDNLMTCFASVEGLIAAASLNNATKSTNQNISCVILFDNEEVGSVSNHGAESNLLPSFVERIISLPEYSKLSYHSLLATSFLVSADMGHAVNPNYSEKYEDKHAPRLNGGVIIKTNANQRYTSNAQTTFLIRRVAQRAGVPVQEFEIRNDSSCGSTVGPHLSTHVRTVDIGLSQLAMHSIRETAGSADVKHYISLFQTYFESFAEIERDLKVD